MPLSEVYRRQVELLVRTLPLVAEEDCFALKGGTAINLVYRELPRLSVDIDLTHLPIADRGISLRGIETCRATAPYGARATPGFTHLTRGRGPATVPALHLSETAGHRGAIAGERLTIQAVLADVAHQREVAGFAVQAGQGLRRGVAGWLRSMASAPVLDARTAAGRPGPVFSRTG